MITKILPFLLWFKGYKPADFKQDLVAGVTVALVLIPQSMAYAQLAGLPVYYGLYAAFLPPMIASLFGSSRQLATGPVAVVSLMSAASLEPLATAGSAEFIAYSIILAMVVGIFQLALGVLRLGLVVNFLSHPVVNAFTNAAAIIIATSQFSKFFGVDVDKAPHHYETLIRVGKAAIDYIHIPTLFYGAGAVLGFMVAIVIDKTMAAKTGQKLDPNQELVGQGLANIFGSIGSSYSTSGSFSRSAVNLQAGAVSGISSVVTSVMVVLTLMFFTPLLYHLLQATLASVIMMAVIGLLNIHGFVHAWKAQWYDGAISIITFVVTLVFAPHFDKGIMV